MEIAKCILYKYIFQFHWTTIFTHVFHAFFMPKIYLKIGSVHDPQGFDI